jgi:predicted amidohydrolase
MAILEMAALQLPTLGMDPKRLEFYIKNAKSKNAKLVLFGEYVLNHFFLELETIPRKMVKEQTKEHIELLQRLSIEYSLIFIAPIIKIKHKKYYKTIAKIDSDKIDYYYQQILINYEHWDEESFFSNRVESIKEPMMFELEGLKIAVMGGFELHFDRFWESIDRNYIDIVLLPTASTFDSNSRWREIIKSRAFLHSCYILRANRLGEYSRENVRWKFYGDSMLVNPNGEIEMMLEDKESMLVEPIDREFSLSHREMWGFNSALRKRGEL